MAVALASAENDNFESLRGAPINASANGQGTYSAQGLSDTIPGFDSCKIIITRTHRWLHCLERGGKTIEPDAGRLEQYVAASLPATYHETPWYCGGPPNSCKMWRGPKADSPFIQVVGYQGDSGNAEYLLDIYKPQH